MEKSTQIKGITKADYPILYAALEKNMIAYNINKIKVKIINRHGVNAFAVSFFGDSIRVTKKVLEIMNEDEIEAILAHEFSHLFNRDSFVSFTILMLFSLPLFIIFYILSKTTLKNITPGESILIFIFTIISFFILLYGTKVVNWITIRQEIRSDREAVLKTKNPEALMSALLKIYVEPFTRNKRPGFFEKIRDSFEYLSLYFYGYTHPVSKERFEYLELAKKMLTAQKTLNNYEIK